MVKGAYFLTCFTAEVVFEATEELPWFAGHFPGTPVFPGVAQVHIAVRLTEEIWAADFAGSAISRLKFHRIVRPGSILKLSLEYSPETQTVSFDFRHDEHRVSSGKFG